MFSEEYILRETKTQKQNLLRIRGRNTLRNQDSKGSIAEEHKKETKTGGKTSYEHEGKTLRGSKSQKKKLP